MGAVVRGNLEIAALGRLVKAQGAGPLRADLLAGLRAAAKPLIEDVRAAALEDLPRRGGLAARTATSEIKVRTRLTGSQAGVRIVNVARSARRGGTTDFGTDTGRLRHPVFGTDRWVTQDLSKPGWFTGTLSREASRVSPDVIAAMSLTLDRIALPGRGQVLLGQTLVAIEGSF